MTQLGQQQLHTADAGDASQFLFAGHTLRDERMHGPPHHLGGVAQKPRPLRPGENADVETGHGDLFCPASRPANWLQRLVASPQMGDHRCSVLRSPDLSSTDTHRMLGSRFRAVSVRY